MALRTVAAVLRPAALAGRAALAVAAIATTTVTTANTEARVRPDGEGFTAADAMRLPFADASFDAVTMSFGLRNVASVETALTEFLRVTKPGGRLVVCEFSHPTNTAFRTIYIEYLMKALPAVARAVSSSPDAYVYLAESIRAWPDQEGLAARISAAGWGPTQWRNLSGGIVALHRATA